MGLMKMLTILEWDWEARNSGLHFCIWNWCCMPKCGAFNKKIQMLVRISPTVSFEEQLSRRLLAFSGSLHGKKVAMPQLVPQCLQK